MNEALYNIIKKKYEEDSLPHALLLWGPSSLEEKEAFVFSISYFINQPAIKKEFDHYISLAQRDLYPDLLRIVPDDKGTIKVEPIKDIDEALSSLPFQSKCRIIYIKNADKMTMQAQNSLLKKLEEPPERNYFILTLNKKNSLLDTIISRSMVIYMHDTDNQIKTSTYLPFMKEKAGTADNIKKEINLIDETYALINNGKLSGFEGAAEMLFRGNDNTAVDADTIKMRLALIALKSKDDNPELSRKIIEFIERKQSFSSDAAIFSNISDLFN